MGDDWSSVGDCERTGALYDELRKSLILARASESKELPSKSLVCEPDADNDRVAFAECVAEYRTRRSRLIRISRAA